MWPLFPTTHAIVGIAVTHEYLSCSWLEEKNAFVELKGSSNYPLTDHEIVGYTLYNPTKLKHQIIEFLDTHKLTNAQVILACENDKATIPPEHLLQYQLLILSIQLNCTMVTSCTAATEVAENALQTLQLADSFERLETSERMYALGLHILGKKNV